MLQTYIARAGNQSSAHDTDFQQTDPHAVAPTIFIIRLVDPHWHCKTNFYQYDEFL